MYVCVWVEEFAKETKPVLIRRAWFRALGIHHSQPLLATYFVCPAPVLATPNEWPPGGLPATLLLYRKGESFGSLVTSFQVRRFVRFYVQMDLSQ